MLCLTEYYYIILYHCYYTLTVLLTNTCPCSSFVSSVGNTRFYLPKFLGNSKHIFAILINLICLLYKRMMFGAALLFSAATISSAYDSNYNIDKSKRYIQFSGIAYCADPFVTKNSVDDWSCKFCQNYPNSTAVTFYGGQVTAQKGYVVYEPTANEIIVSFSGTDPVNLRNWIDDLDFRKVDYPGCSSNGCQVHEGFYRNYESVKEQVQQLVKEFKSTYATASITVTGHSLGAAVTALCTADLTALGYELTTPYTYGMPRVGDEAFQTWYRDTMIGTFRVTHHKDPVPHLPLQDWGFKHMPYEAFYNKDDYETGTTVCNYDGEDPECSDQYKVDANVIDHAHYMGWDFGKEYFSWGCEV